MFIKRLYDHSNIAAIAFLIFIASFIFINFKWGVVASPIYQLGMFSHVAHTTDTQYVHTFYVDDKPLALGELPIAHADMIRVSFSHYQNHIENNKAVMSVFSKYSLKLFNRPLSPGNFTNAITDTEAGIWFQHLLRSYSIPVNRMSVYANKYLWRDGVLEPIGDEELKYNFAANL